MNIILYIIFSYLAYYFIIGFLEFDTRKHRDDAVSLGLASPLILPIILVAIIIGSARRFGEYIRSKFK